MNTIKKEYEYFRMFKDCPQLYDVWLEYFNNSKMFNEFKDDVFRQIYIKIFYHERME